MSHSKHDHFKGKDAYEHVLQKKSDMASEIHGDELPGHLGSFLDSCRDVAILQLVFWTFSFVLNSSVNQTLFTLIVLTIVWALWKTVRSTWFSWALLERLHRVLKEERYEIENHREQEREELTALYASKGFSGELLEDVIDVLMADDERLLKVMMEEEMGLNLEHYEHPLKIGLGSLLGALFSGALLIGLHWVLPVYGLVSAGIIIISLSGMFMAKLQKNDQLSALIWNGGASIVILGITYFITYWIQPFFTHHV